MGLPVLAVKNVQAGQAGGAVFLIALIGMDKEVVTILVEEIGLAESAGLRRKIDEHGHPLLQRRAVATR